MHTQQQETVIAALMLQAKDLLKKQDFSKKIRRNIDSTEKSAT